MSKRGLAFALSKRLLGRVVVVGVGNPYCRDDGSGVCLVKRLVHSESLKPLLVGEFPELYLTEIIQEDPDVVMWVDAAQVQGPPGSVAIVEEDQLSKPFGNAHQAPLSTIMKYISARTGADTFLLSIQPQRVSSGIGLSPPVRTAVNKIAELINRIAARGGAPKR